MERVIFNEKYPIWKEEIIKEKLNKTLDEIVDYFINRIKENPKVKFIWVFDHYEHTKSIWWEISSDIKWAKIINFCFWKELVNPLWLGVRPRGIWIIELNDKFVITFLEAPSEKWTETMKKWVEELK
jgi:hypothetical protein